MAKARTIDEAVETVETTEEKPVAETTKETTTVISTYGNNCKFTVENTTVEIKGERLAGKIIEVETILDTANWQAVLKKYANHPLIKNQLIYAK